MYFDKNPELGLNNILNPHFPILNSEKNKFDCPICLYHGPFLNVNDPTGKREHAKCPNCSSLERHRVMWLTLQNISKNNNLGSLSLLHIAPEIQLRDLLRKKFKSYTTADLSSRKVDHHVDLRNLPFADQSYDVVIACHVLEHIKEDILALQNIRRILKPNGFAILQVPILAKKTVEYPEPNKQEWFHVRSPGEDYFERYLTVFTRVDRFSSSSFDSRFQPYIYENRTRWPKVPFIFANTFLQLSLPSSGTIVWHRMELWRHHDV